MVSRQRKSNSYAGTVRSNRFFQQTYSNRARSSANPRIHTDRSTVAVSTVFDRFQFPNNGRNYEATNADFQNSLNWAIHAWILILGRLLGWWIHPRFFVFDIFWRAMSNPRVLTASDTGDVRNGAISLGTAIPPSVHSLC